MALKIMFMLFNLRFSELGAAQTKMNPHHDRFTAVPPSIPAAMFLD
jgi:hypothetical protein